MVVQITDREYKTVCEWWKERHFPILVRSLLPDTSYVVYHNNKPIIFTSLYLSKDADCAMAMTAWYTANPDTEWEERFDGLQELEKFLETVGKENGVRQLISFTSKENLSKNLQATGYVPIEQGTYLIRNF